MTKPRPRRDRSDPEIDEVSWRFICDATTPEDETENGWLLVTLRFNDNAQRAIVPPPSGKTTSQLWDQFGAGILAWWTKDAPGTRPKCWWRYSAKGPRQRIGGVGVCRREVLNWPRYIGDYGLPLPDEWVLGNEVTRHPFRAMGIPAFDTENPPTFESQAEYLRRNAPFLPGEQARITKAAYQPEQIELRHDRRAGTP